MARQQTRRELLAGVVGSVASLSGCAGVRFPSKASTPSHRSTSRSPASTPTPTEATPTETPTSTDTSNDVLVPDTPIDVRGAIYLPARVFNFYQMWRAYDPAVVERDLGYAASINLNAIRTWASFEWWREDPQAHGDAIDHFLRAADERGIEVLFGLFEGVGAQPTRENLLNSDPLTATGVSSPSRDVFLDWTRWSIPNEFVTWFMDRYRDDERLLAIEVMNEPGWRDAHVEFARAMFETMLDERGRIPLTVGSTSMVNNNEFLDWEIDILQFHYNFPTSREQLADALRKVRTLGDALDRPVWLTEWQRVRSNPGFHTPPPKDQRVPDYSSMAPVIAEGGFGNFFWSLMVQPAYTVSQRKLGILNGLFHEDGAVYSLDDARALAAMSGDASYVGEERRAWPEWALPVKEAYLSETHP